MSEPRRSSQSELARARTARRAQRLALKVHGEGGDRASAAQLARGGDDNRIYCAYTIGAVEVDARPHLVMVNFGVKAAHCSEEDCRRIIAAALASLPRVAGGVRRKKREDDIEGWVGQNEDNDEAGGNLLGLDPRQPIFLRVCESKTCFTFADISAAKQAYTLFNSAEGHVLLGRKVRCAYANSVLPHQPGVVARPRLAVSWEKYAADAVLCSQSSTSTSRSSSSNSASTGDAAGNATIPSVPGLSLVLDVISTEEEEELVRKIEEHGSCEGGAGWSSCARKDARERLGFKMDDHRRVMHFGHAFDYDTRGIGCRKTQGSLPDFLQALILKLKIHWCDGDDESNTFDQCTVNEYLPGHGIASHVDTHSTFGPTLCSVSLLSQTVMSFVHSVTGARVDLILPPRSLLILKGEARYVWTHGIASRTTDLVQVARAGKEEEVLVPRTTRLSLTLRTLRDVATKGPCVCAWPRWCDSAQGTKIIPDVLPLGEGGTAIECKRRKMKK